MIIHLPTLSRWIRSLVLIVVVAIVTCKVLQWTAPLLLPADPYRIPAGDALSVKASSEHLSSSQQFTQFIDNTAKEMASRLKLFFLSGE
ncbi:MAG: hypothetical protein JWN30_835 [Bacilli bacterium]|nr:hypothetical protein [Bacilli bacterium]